MKHHRMSVVPVQNASSPSVLLLGQMDAVDDESDDDISHQSSLVTDESSDQDSFQRGLDAELDRELEQMIRQTSREIDDEIQQQIDDQLNAQFDDYMEDYFRMAQQEEELKRTQPVMDLSKESKAAFKAYDIPVMSAIDCHDSLKGTTTITNLNAQIQQVIDQYKATNLLEE